MLRRMMTREKACATLGAVVAAVVFALVWILARTRREKR
jgi:hypothetical protein